MTDRTKLEKAIAALKAAKNHLDHHRLVHIDVARLQRANAKLREEVAQLKDKLAASSKNERENTEWEAIRQQYTSRRITPRKGGKLRLPDRCAP